MESGIGDLLKQLPTGIILMFCGSALLLVFAIGYIVTVRNRRARGAVPAVSADAMPVAASMDDDFSDLPDLDQLSDRETLQAEPNPPEVPIPAAPPVLVQPAAAPAAAPDAHRVSLAEGEAVEAVEVFTVLRDVAEGGLIIRIGDKAYRNPPAVADAEFKRRYHNTLRDLTGAQPPIDATPTSPTPPKTATGEITLEANEPMPSFRADEPIPGDLPKFIIPDTIVKPKRGQRPSAEPIPEINIAASIESFLQHKLARSPQYSGRNIHVRPALHGSIKIEVDGAFYESVGEVADEDVRDYLTAAIAEWQARQ